MDHGNSVSIDEAAVHAELEQLADGVLSNGSSPPPGPDAVPQEAPPPLMDWTQASAGLVLAIDKVLVPNWELESTEKDALAEGLRITLSAFFPTLNIDPRVQALLVLGSVVTTIAAKRIDVASRKMVPFRKPKPKADGTTDDDNAGAADQSRAAA